jgi:hypothetical protein
MNEINYLGGLFFVLFGCCDGTVVLGAIIIYLTPPTWLKEIVVSVQLLIVVCPACTGKCRVDAIV